MSPTIKCMKLDFMLLKPYFKSMALILLVPLMFPFFTGTLLEGLSFATTVLAMTTAYTFSIAEKNSLERFYGFLPVDRKRLVGGRYLAIFGIGYISIVLEAIVQSLILIFIKSVPLQIADIAFSTLACALLFSIYAGVQIPGYYKYGSIKGKIFMFIPTAGFLILYYSFSLLKDSQAGAAPKILSNTLLLSASGCILLVLILGISVSVSNRIMNHIK